MVKRLQSGHVVTLEKVQEQFAAWRSQPQRSKSIPDHLWEAAVSLCGEYSVCQVSRALRLDYKVLRKRYRNASSTQAQGHFVELPPLCPQAEVVIECEDRSQNHLRIQCRGRMDEGIVNLVRGFFGGQP